MERNAKWKEAKGKALRIGLETAERLYLDGKRVYIVNIIVYPGNG